MADERERLLKLRRLKELQTRAARPNLTREPLETRAVERETISGRLYGAAEAATALGTGAVAGMASMPVAGVAALGDIALRKAAGYDEPSPSGEIIDKYTVDGYQPKTDAGQRTLAVAAAPFQALDRGVTAVANKVQDADIAATRNAYELMGREVPPMDGGIALLPTAVKLGPDLLATAAGLRMPRSPLQRLSDVSRVEKQAADMGVDLAAKTDVQGAQLQGAADRMEPASNPSENMEAITDAVRRERASESQRIGRLFDEAEGLPSAPPRAAGARLVESTPEAHNLSGWKQPQGGKGYVYSISRNGEEVGFVDVSIMPDGTARIEDVVTYEGSGSLGLSVVREVLQDLRQKHPEIKAVSGERVSGARRGGEHGWAGSGVEVRRTLPDLAQPASGQRAAVPSRSAGALHGRLQNATSRFITGEMKSVQSLLDESAAFGIPAQRNLSEVMGVRNSATVPVNSLFNFRAKINSNLPSDIHSPEYSALSSMRREVDAFLNETLTSDLVSGNPAAVTKWQEAIGQWGEFKTLFDENKVIRKLQDENATAEQVKNLIFGLNVIRAPRQAGTVVKGLKEILGEDSPEFKTLRSSALSDLLLPIVDAEPNMAKFVKNYDAFARNNPTLANELFDTATREQLQGLRDFAAAIDKNTPLETRVRNAGFARAAAVLAAGHGIAQSSLRVSFIARALGALKPGAGTARKNKMLTELLGYDPRKSLFTTDPVKNVAALQELEEGADDEPRTISDLVTRLRQ